MADNNIRKSITTKKTDGSHDPATEDTRDIFDKALDYAPNAAAAAAVAGGAFIGSRFMKGKSLRKPKTNALGQRDQAVIVGRQQGRQEPTLPSTAPAPSRPIETGSLITGREIGSSWAPGTVGTRRRR